jgi:hypothetical protein
MVGGGLRQLEEFVSTTPSKLGNLLPKKCNRYMNASLGISGAKQPVPPGCLTGLWPQLSGYFISKSV